MRFKALLALLLGLLIAGPLAAQTFITSPPPPPAMEPENTLYLDLTSGGRVTIQLRPDVAPGHVARIKELTRKGFYDGLLFHRVIEGFMAQAGDPRGDGTGGSDLPDLAAEFNGLPHTRGALGMARTMEPNSANSQFYIMLVPRLAMDGKYTVFGRVVAGMNFVDSIERGEPPVNPTRIARASIGSDNIAPLTAAELAAAAAIPLRAPPPPPVEAPPAPATTPPDAAAAAPADAAPATS
ncbi:MAG TPA: peptidylprolyl isomerase, partial [Allosphingosinicella sp.]